MPRAPRNAARALAAALVLVLTPGLARASYRAKAEEQTDFIQARYYDSDAHLYRPWLPALPGDLAYDYMWGNGVQFTVLVSGTRYNPAKYGQTLKDVCASLRRYWDGAGPVPGFKDTYLPTKDAARYYDDNAWVVLGFVEAYEVTKDASYLDRARETQRFCLSGWDGKLGGGIYWREDKQTKNTCSNAPTAAAAARLYLVGHDADQLPWAKRIVDWTDKTLQDSDGLFCDNIRLDGHISKYKWTYNSALMIRSNVLLYQATKDRKRLAAARRIADAGLKRWVDPDTGGFTNNARFNHLFSESLLRLYDVTKDLRYLNAVRRDASFGYRYVRDPEGGYHDAWRKDHKPGERKELIENAAVARLFWLLTPYPDVDELQAQAEKAEKRKDWKRAESLRRQAAESDAP
ncbi:MAG TPA: glycoside hydrolase family 76 protein [Armatimonadota bacterium]|jgi:hypothetical protein